MGSRGQQKGVSGIDLCHGLSQLVLYLKAAVKGWVPVPCSPHLHQGRHCVPILMGGVSQEIHPQELAGTEQTLSLSQANIAVPLSRQGEELQNPRLVWTGRDLKGSSHSTPCPGQ